MTSAAATLDPIQFPEYWDKLIVGDVVSPGYCTWEGWERPYEWDEKKGKGTQGATLTFVQKPLAKGSFTFFLWDNGTLGTGHNHFAEWQAVKPLFKFDPTKKKVTAIGVFHPALDDLDINSVICESIGGIVNVGQGMYSVTVRLKEYNPTNNKNAAATPNTTTTASTTGEDTSTSAPDALNENQSTLADQAKAPTP